MKEPETHYEWSWDTAKFLMDCIESDDFLVTHRTKYTGKRGNTVHSLKAYKAKDMKTGQETGKVCGHFSCREWSDPSYPEPISRHHPSQFMVFRAARYPWHNQVSID